MSLSSSPLDVTLGPEQSAGESSARAVELAAGHVIGRHVVIERLGAGSMGVVYAAYDPELDRRIAIKVLREPAAPGTPRRTRMLREAQSLARLAHPNVVAIHDVGTLDERVWIAMEYVEGETLAAWCRRTNPSWREAVAAMSAAGRGLAAAHAVGLVHRDFKPDNVMVGNDGRVRVMDFGLAFAVAASDVFDPPSESTRLPISSQAQTLAGALLGTPGYMPPEQLHHHDVDAVSDQFAFCVTLWEACYGTKPFAGDTVVEVSTAVVQGRIEPPPAGSRVPRWLRDIALRGMATERAHRFGSMTELLESLDRGQSRARRRVIAAAAAATVILGAVGWASYATLERARVAACTRDGEAIAQVWPGVGDDERTAVRDAIAATGAPFAEGTIERVDRLLDDHARQWATTRASTCTSRALDVDTRARADACLEDRRDDLATLIEALTNVDRGGATMAITSASTLRRATECEDPETLALVDVAPQGEGRETDRALRGRIARMRTRLRVGGARDAVDEAATIVQDAEALGVEVLTARAHAVHATALQDASKFEEAVRAWQTALTIGIGLGRDDLAIEAVANLVFTVGYRLGRHDEALRLAEIGHALIRHAGPKARSGEVLLLHHEAIVRVLGGDADTAVRLMELAQADAIAEFGTDHPAVGRLVTDLGAVHATAGHHELALDHYYRALAIQEAAFGSDHPILEGTLANIGGTLGQLGENAKAAELSRRALALAEANHGEQHFDVATALENLGTALNRLGEHEQAIDPLQRALVLYDTILPDDHPDLANGLSRLAHAEIEVGRIDDAFAHAKRALEIYEGRADIDATHGAGVHTVIGQALLARGETANAIVHLEKAVAYDEAMPEFRAGAGFALAQAIQRSGGDMIRARALAKQAKHHAAASKVNHARLDAALDAWRVEHGE